MTQPTPVPAVLCSACSLPWADHIDCASWRLDWCDDDTDPPVTLEDCVALMRAERRGPVGPSGPPGPQGASGSPGRVVSYATGAQS